MVMIVSHIPSNPLPQAGGAARLGSLLPSRSGVGPRRSGIAHPVATGEQVRKSHCPSRPRDGMGVRSC